MSARHAPIYPNIPLDAPTEINSGRKNADRIVPPTEDDIKMTAEAMNPCSISIADPIAYIANMFRKKCIHPA